MADDANQRIAALEAAVLELRQELAQRREPRARSMRQTHRCPVCGGGRLLHFRRIHEMAHGGMIDLALQKQFSTWWGIQLSAAVLEAFACRNCRLVEWHAITLDDVKPDGTTVVELEAADDAPIDPTPYR